MSKEFASDAEVSKCFGTNSRPLDLQRMTGSSHPRWVHCQGSSYPRGVHYQGSSHPRGVHYQGSSHSRGVHYQGSSHSRGVHYQGSSHSRGVHYQGFLPMLLIHCHCPALFSDWKLVTSWLHHAVWADDWSVTETETSPFPL